MEKGSIEAPAADDAPDNADSPDVTIPSNTTYPKMFRPVTRTLVDQNRWNHEVSRARLRKEAQSD